MAYEYAKVILYAYPYLPALAEAVGVGAENKAYLSFRGRESTLALAETIAEELAVKSRLLRLKKAADEAVAACSEEELFLLEYKYFRRRRLLAERFAGMADSCSERHYFRRQAALLKKIVSALALRGWTEQAYFAAFGAFSPFCRVLAALGEGQETAIVAHRNRRGIALCAQKSDRPRSADLLPRSTSTATATAAAHRIQMTTICTAPIEEEAGVSCVPSSPLPDTASR